MLPSPSQWSRPLNSEQNLFWSAIGHSKKWFNDSLTSKLLHLIIEHLTLRISFDCWWSNKGWKILLSLSSYRNNGKPRKHTKGWPSNSIVVSLIMLLQWIQWIPVNRFKIRWTPSSSSFDNLLCYYHYFFGYSAGVSLHFVNVIRGPSQVVLGG